MKEKVLKALRESEGYISGQELCQMFSVSRTAIWKVIHQLLDEGYEIEAVNKKGYRLISQPDIISEAEIASRIEACTMGNTVRFYDEVTSTNDEAKMLAERGAKHGTLVVAECQLRGKGRRLRQWSSPKGVGIWMSLILRPDFEPSEASMLTLLAALAVYDAMEAHGVSCQIKWPNDIVIDGKKVCGILTEMSAQPEYINYIVIGIGINVHNASFPEEIASVATSLALEGFSDVKRSALIAEIMKAFARYYEKFMIEKDVGFVRKLYDERLVNMRQEVYICEKDGKRSGICHGIDAKGQLIVVIDGKEEHIMSGEVSVRGVLGYV